MPDDLHDLRAGRIRLRPSSALHVLKPERTGRVHAGHGKHVEGTCAVVNGRGRAGPEAAHRVAWRTSRARIEIGPGRVGQWRSERRLRRGRGDVEDRDGVCVEHARSIVVRRRSAAAKWQDGCEPRHEASAGGTGVRAGAGHQEIVPEDVHAGAQPLLHVGELRLRVSDSLRGTDDGEHAGRDRHGNRRGDERLEQGEPRLTPPGRRHGACLVRMVTSRAPLRPPVDPNPQNDLVFVSRTARTDQRRTYTVPGGLAPPSPRTLPARSR